MMLRLAAVAVVLLYFISEYNCEGKQVLHFLTKTRNGDLYLTRVEKEGSLKESVEEEIVDESSDNIDWESEIGNDYAPGSR